MRKGTVKDRIFSRLKEHRTSIIVGVITIVLASVIMSSIHYFINVMTTKEDYAVSVDIGFQTGDISYGIDYSTSDLASTIVIKNVGGLPLKNLRGEISVTNEYFGVLPSFRISPLMEPEVYWEQHPGHLVFNWSVMNPGEELKIPLVEQLEPIYEWEFWLKADGVTFNDTFKCNDCNNKHKTFLLSKGG